MGKGRLAKPQRQAGALTAHVLAVIRLTAVQPCRRGRGFETAEHAEERGRFDVALVAVLSDAGLRRSETAALTWGDVQRGDDGSGRITVGGWAWPAAWPRTARQPTRSNARAAGNRTAGWSDRYTRGESAGSALRYL